MLSVYFIRLINIIHIQYEVLIMPDNNKFQIYCALELHQRIF